MKRVFGMITTAPSTPYTRVSLESFFHHTPLAQHDRFFLIDNDGGWKESDDPQVTVIRNAAPRSFAENANQLVRCALEAEAGLTLLNNDLVFTPQWSEPLDASHDAILSPLSNREVQYMTSVAVAKNGNILSSKLFTTPLHLDDYTENREAFDYVSAVHRRHATGYHPVYMLPFFCVKIPYWVLTTVGIFDEGFTPAGGEDYDYCVRAHLEGIPIQFALQSYVLHFGGKSTWSGVENPEARRAREGGFCSRFREKWGEHLYDLIFTETTEKRLPLAEIQQAHERGDIATVVRALAALPR